MPIKEYFQKAIEREASDLHLVAGSLPALRVSGSLVKINDTPVKNEELEKGLDFMLSEEQKKRLNEEKELDFSFRVDDRFFRVNIHFQERELGLAARLMPKDPPAPDEIDFDNTLYELTRLNDGLILVTGPAGAGKSTTLATILDIINQERSSHIITVEDPIEYRFQDKKSIVEQREVNFDTNSFASALKYSLRQDPNVIMVGEMRDRETMATALRAAETGHLVLSTLHTATATETVSRIVDMFPLESHQRVLNQLSTCLRAVISQQLLPKISGGRVVAREIMVNNTAISSLIQNDKIQQIYNAIETGSQEGMITMNKAIENLLEKGVISEKLASSRKRDENTSATYY